MLFNRETKKQRKAQKLISKRTSNIKEAGTIGKRLFPCFRAEEVVASIMKDSKRRSEYQIEGDGISEVKKAKLTPDNEKGNNIY